MTYTKVRHRFCGNFLYLNTENEGEHSMTTFPILKTAEIDLGVN